MHRLDQEITEMERSYVQLHEKSIKESLIRDQKTQDMNA